MASDSVSLLATFRDLCSKDSNPLKLATHFQTGGETEMKGDRPRGKMDFSKS
ncbi:hypothetical protein BgiMline_016014, partial [Biomphalaria glabrata]